MRSPVYWPGTAGCWHPPPGRLALPVRGISVHVLASSKHSTAGQAPQLHHRLGSTARSTRIATGRASCRPVSDRVQRLEEIRNDRHRKHWLSPCRAMRVRGHPVRLDSVPDRASGLHNICSYPWRTDRHAFSPLMLLMLTVWLDTFHRNKKSHLLFCSRPTSGLARASHLTLPFCASEADA